MKNNDRSERTALARKTMSSPCKWLRDHKLLGLPGEKHILDFGCGHNVDATQLGALGFDVTGWDPYWKPRDGKPCKPAWDIVICNYVLNTLPDRDERLGVLADIWECLAPGGVAYITVRRDKNRLNGWTAIDTWQAYIKLDWPVLKATSTYAIYRLEKKALTFNPYKVAATI